MGGRWHVFVFNGVTCVCGVRDPFASIASIALFVVILANVVCSRLSITFLIFAIHSRKPAQNVFQSCVRTIATTIRKPPVPSKAIIITTKVNASAVKQHSIFIDTDEIGGTARQQAGACHEYIELGLLLDSEYGYFSVMSVYCHFFHPFQGWIQHSIQYMHCI